MTTPLKQGTIVTYDKRGYYIYSHHHTENGEHYYDIETLNKDEFLMSMPGGMLPVKDKDNESKTSRLS